MSGGGFAPNQDVGRFRLSDYVPPHDVPPSACTPCPGLGSGRCCQRPRNLSAAPDKPRRQWRPWKR
jgi:hypothetical protein